MDTDPLSPVLANFSARARVFYTGNLCERTIFDEGLNAGFLHLLRSGSMQVRDHSRRVITLAEPSLVFYSRPLTHSFRPDPTIGADLACASVEFDHRAFNPIALVLPPLFSCNLREMPDSRSLLEMLFDEAFAARVARIEVLNRLFELVLIHVLRATIRRGGDNAGFLRGLAHEQLSKALNAIHSKPEEGWSLEKLARLAAMSRSNFAETFRREVGQTPGEYLTRWRITTAQALLHRGTPLKLVSERVGYGSQAGFLRAFKQVVGMSPREWQRR